MPPDDETIACASLPAAALAGLAGFRREPGVTVTPAGDRAWVRWPPGAGRVLDAIRPIAGAELYTRRNGQWFRLGHRLPSFGPPVDASPGMPLDRAVTPAPVSPEPPDTSPLTPVILTLVRDDRPRSATALECSLEALARWADVAPTARIGALAAARSGPRVLVRGRPLPPVAGADRFWGDRVLVPLGFRPEPGLPESAVLSALGAAADATLVLSAGSVETVPGSAFRPLTRAGVRLARGGVPT